MNCQRCGKKPGTYLCSVCKRLVCSDCEIIKDEKVYCLDHVPKEVVLAIKPKREINRPLGISIIAVSGIIFALISMFVVLVTSMFISFSELLAEANITSTETEAFYGLSFLSIIALIIAFTQFAVSYGIWNMKKWALYAQIILYILNFALNFSEIYLTTYVLVLILVILSMLIFYLLYKRKLFS